jgi:ATP-dependent helicase/nuclease subunit A
VAFVGRWARLAPSLQALRTEEEREAAREELNGLYVAVTRARRRLVVSSIEPRRKASPSPGGIAGRLAQPWAPAAPVRHGESTERSASSHRLAGAGVPAGVPRAGAGPRARFGDTRRHADRRGFPPVMQWSTALATEPASHGWTKPWAQPPPNSGSSR